MSKNGAEIDLLTAEKLLSDEILTQSTAFHLQQCVEKLFKAILENNNILIPKTHNLERLHALIQEIDSFVKQVFNNMKEILERG